MKLGSLTGRNVKVLPEKDDFYLSHGGAVISDFFFSVNSR